MNKNANNIDERQAKGLSILSGTLLPFARNLLGKKGFIEVDIITKWADIVGKELAGYSFPQKISFKKGCKNYFGYNAVSGIKIIQNQQAAATNPDLVNEYEKPYAYKLNKEEEKYIENLAEPIDNPKLKAIIAKLGKSVFNKNKNKK